MASKSAKAAGSPEPYREQGARDAEGEDLRYAPPVERSVGATLAVRLRPLPPPPAKRGLGLAAGVSGAAGVLSVALGAGARAIPPLLFAGLAGFASFQHWWQGPRRRGAAPIVELSREPAARGDSVSVYVESRQRGHATIGVALLCEEWCRGESGLGERERVVYRMLLEDVFAPGKWGAVWRSEGHFFVERDAPVSFATTRFGVNWAIEVTLGFGEARFVLPFRVLPLARAAAKVPTKPAPGEREQFSLSFGCEAYGAGDELDAVVRGPAGARAAVRLLFRAKPTALALEHLATLTPEEECLESAEVVFAANGEAPLRFTLPFTPPTYVGKLISVQWLVRVTIEGRPPQDFPFEVT